MPFQAPLNQTTDTELLAILLGNRRTAETLLRDAGSLFALLSQDDQTTDNLLCSEGKRTYAGNPLLKLQAARELAARAIAEQLQQRSALSSPRAVSDFLKLSLAGLQREVFVVILLDAQHRVIKSEELFRGTLTQTSVYPREVVKTALRVPARIVWTRFCNSGRFSDGVRLTGFEG